MITRISIFGALLGILSLPLHGVTAMAAVVQPAEADHTIVINDLTVHDGSVSGTVVNKTSSTLRGVELLLRQEWHWKDELHPGSESPGRSLPFTLDGEVGPHASTRFTFQTPDLPQRTDGRFVTSMEVTRFSQVGP